MIDIKTLSVLLKKEVIKCSLINKARSTINITYFENEDSIKPICREFSIYELQHLIKEDIRKKDFIFSISIYKKHIMISIWTKEGKHRIASKSELEVLVLGYIWILEKLNEKNPK